MYPRSSLPAVPSLVLSTLLATAAAHAWDCSPPADAEQAFTDSDAVFVGIISEQEPDFPIVGGPPPYRWVRFRVLQSWKGVVSTEVEIITEPGGSFPSFGLSKDVGDKLLVYATMNADEEKLETWACGVHEFDCPYIGCMAEEHIAEFSRLGFEELSLSDPPDTWFPRADVQNRRSPWAPCGAGMGLATILSLAGLLATPKAVRAIPAR